MELSDSDVREFQRLWRQENGREIDSETARDYASKLLRFIEIMSSNDHSPPDKPP